MSPGGKGFKTYFDMRLGTVIFTKSLMPELVQHREYTYSCFCPLSRTPDEKKQNNYVRAIC